MTSYIIVETSQARFLLYSFGITIFQGIMVILPISGVLVSKGTSLQDFHMTIMASKYDFGTCLCRSIPRTLECWDVHYYLQHAAINQNTDFPSIK